MACVVKISIRLCESAVVVVVVEKTIKLETALEKECQTREKCECHRVKIQVRKVSMQTPMSFCCTFAVAVVALVVVVVVVDSSHVRHYDQNCHYDYRIAMYQLNGVG